MIRASDGTAVTLVSIVGQYRPAPGADRQTVVLARVLSEKGVYLLDFLDEMTATRGYKEIRSASARLLQGRIPGEALVCFLLNNFSQYPKEVSE